MTLIERAVRRAGLPVAMSEGFNPRPRIAFPSALALGISSEDEVISLQLSEWLSPAEISRRLTPQLIPGITLTRIEPLRNKLSAQVKSEQYRIIFNDTSLTLSPEQIKNLLNQPEIIITRTRPGDLPKKINIKLYLQKIELDQRALIVTLKITPQGTARPEEVLIALGLKGSLKDGTWSIHKILSLVT